METSSNFTPALRNLLTGVAAYVGNGEAKEFHIIANAKWPDSNGGLFIGSRFSAYFSHIPEDLNHLKDINPRFGLASYHLEEVDAKYVKNLINNELLPHNEDWERTFQYASRYHNSSLSWAKTWLLKTLPELRHGQEFPSIEDCRKTHHAMVVLQKSCPLPGFASAQFFKALFDDTFAGFSELKHHRALYADFDINSPDEGLPPWAATFLSEAGEQVDVARQEQEMPICEKFKNISEFFGKRLAYAFNPSQEWRPRDSEKTSTSPGKPDLSKPKGEEKKGTASNYRILSFPLFETQKVYEDKEKKWRRKGPYIGLFALLINPASTKTPQDFLNYAEDLGALLDSLAAPIQAAREREFWSSQIPENLDDKSTGEILRDFAAMFCGVAVQPTTDYKPVLTVEHAVLLLKADKTGFILPPLYWPQKPNQQGTALQAKWLPTTMLPEDDEELNRFGHATMSRIRDAEKRIAAIRHSQEANRGRGFLASAHDYSKDLNVLDRLVGTFLNEVAEIRNVVGVHITEPKTRDDIDRKFGQLNRLQEALDLRNRFVMAHARTESLTFFPQPEWCVDLVKKGCRCDLYDLIRLLVWHPLGWVRYHQLADRQPDAAPLPQAEVADWSRLFAYDERGLHPELDERLHNYLCLLFLGRHEGGLNSGITVEQFGQLHPPPVLNDHCGMTEQIIWAALPEQERANRWTPHAELLPLLVFSLRAAFQHAWLRTFFDAADGTPRMVQHISLQSDDQRHPSGYYSVYRLNLDFPMPTRPPDAPAPATPVSLPWGDWARQMGHYRGKTRPWEWRLSIEPPLPAPQSPDSFQPSAIHTDPWHFRICIQTGI